MKHIVNARRIREFVVYNIYSENKTMYVKMNNKYLIEVLDLTGF